VHCSAHRRRDHDGWLKCDEIIGHALRLLLAARRQFDVGLSTVKDGGIGTFGMTQK
jgi:hypothetical protein